MSALGLLALAVGCGAKDGASQSSNRPPSQGANTPFEEFDNNAKRLLNADGKWQDPHGGTMTVGKTDRIGFAIGEGQELKKKIDVLVPGSLTTPVGPVQVGPKMRATLRANPADADITPSDAVDLSTGSDVQLLWTWLVHPKRPTDALQLTVLLEIPLSNGQTVSNEIPHEIAVKRTFVYTVEELATHWGTWSAVGATLISVAGWFIQRRRRKRAIAVPAA